MNALPKWSSNLQWLMEFNLSPMYGQNYTWQRAHVYFSFHRAVQNVLIWQVNGVLNLSYSIFSTFRSISWTESQAKERKREKERVSRRKKTDTCSILRPVCFIANDIRSITFPHKIPLLLNWFYNGRSNTLTKFCKKTQVQRSTVRNTHL